MYVIPLWSRRCPDTTLIVEATASLSEFRRLSGSSLPWGSADTLERVLLEIGDGLPCPCKVVPFGRGAHGNEIEAVDPCRVQAQNFLLCLLGYGLIAILHAHVVGNLKRSERVYQRLRGPVPNRVGTPNDV